MKRTLLLMTVLGGLVALIAVGSRSTSPGSNPLVRYSLSSAARYTMCGHVEERLPAGSYLYLRVRDDEGAQHWVATLRSTAPSTPEVSVRVLARAENFPSARLHRSFAPLLFGAVSESSPCRPQQSR
ncbi:hypothetical protein [Hyalangium rubrum]|uniref:Uncharacterized protein n=1 Tax=Hyalangium rubrum TaxID=3103134 RepID=A0ABU5GZW5_9BACT|nr:hypothetical protein [Hyalangium sp. s54d21]MDY7226576.1 hypothetical protein [Hyalangium sp. s54d21]